MSKFLQSPPSIRVAASVIVVATAIVVVGGGIVIRVLDHREYGNIWVGMWWALQTVTTVGYGDVTPQRPIGRLVGAVVMLEGITFVAIITAAITSTFVARAAQERALAEGADTAAFEERVEGRLDEQGRRLDEIHAMLRDLGRRRCRRPTWSRAPDGAAPDGTERLRRAGSRHARRALQPSAPAPPATAASGGPATSSE